MTEHVQALARGVWDARRRRALPGPREVAQLARCLALAVAQDVGECEGYDPELDVRVEWLRALIRARRQSPGWMTPQAHADLECAAAMVLGVLREEAMRTAGK